MVITVGCCCFVTLPLQVALFMCQPDCPGVRSRAQWLGAGVGAVGLRTGAGWGLGDECSAQEEDSSHGESLDTYLLSTYYVLGTF